jgi:hypothetical protein
MEAGRGGSGRGGVAQIEFAQASPVAEERVSAHGSRFLCSSRAPTPKVIGEGESSGACTYIANSVAGGGAVLAHTEAREERAPRVLVEGGEGVVHVSARQDLCERRLAGA